MASIYHPYEQEKYQTFNSHLTTIMGKAPKKAETILGQDINANIGVRGEEEGFEQVIGPHGFDNRNEKGNWALQCVRRFQVEQR